MLRAREPGTSSWSLRLSFLYLPSAAGHPGGVSSQARLCRPLLSIHPARSRLKLPPSHRGEKSTAALLRLLSRCASEGERSTLPVFGSDRALPTEGHSFTPYFLLWGGPPLYLLYSLNRSLLLFPCRSYVLPTLLIPAVSLSWGSASSALFPLTDPY